MSPLSSAAWTPSGDVERCADAASQSSSPQAITLALTPLAMNRRLPDEKAVRGIAADAAGISAFAVSVFRIFASPYSETSPSEAPLSRNRDPPHFRGLEGNALDSNARQSLQARYSFSPPPSIRSHGHTLSIT
jgi:hypothetical protein